MKRTSIYYFSLAALAAGSMASCQDYDPFDDNTLQAITAEQKFQATLKEYTDNFEKRYGKIDPNHDWGMNMPGISGSTRATVDNRNEWVSKYHLNVPGWPDTYYSKAVSGEQTNGYHSVSSSGDNPSYSITVPTADRHPAGDVTDEEIQYVSWWFRTHKPTSIQVHWTDFYVQGISADNDRDSDGNLINTIERYEKKESGWTRGQDDHSIYTIDYFSAAVMQPDIATSEDGWDHVKNYNRNGSNSLDAVNPIDMRKDTINWNLTSDYKCNYTNSENATVPTDNRLIAFYMSSGTENFRAHYPQDTGEQDHDWFYKYVNGVKQDTRDQGEQSWALVHLAFVGPSGRIYDGYYLGFDYQCYKPETQDGEGNVNKYCYHEADGYYSNWIFKLTPATPLEEPQLVDLSRRIMCEDLGNTYDFDFNDVVFDATYNISADDYAGYLDGSKSDSPIDITIRLQAAGGTMPIYVGSNPQANMEAHHLLGNHRSDTPVNVDAPSGATSPIAIYHYKLEFAGGTTLDERKQALSLNNIPICVVNSGNIGGTYLTSSNTAWGSEYVPEINRPTPQNPGNVSAPRAFGVPVGVKWMKECEFIEEGYTYFSKWVSDMTNYGDGSSNPWYKGPFGTTTKIYNY